MMALDTDTGITGWGYWQFNEATVRLSEEQFESLVAPTLNTFNECSEVLHKEARFSFWDEVNLHEVLTSPTPEIFTMDQKVSPPWKSYTLRERLKIKKAKATR